MCSMSVLCPLCAQTSFSSIDALRSSLIKAANGPLSCPICHELFLGLDKLTIHLFSHTTLMTTTTTEESPIDVASGVVGVVPAPIAAPPNDTTKNDYKAKKIKKAKANAVLDKTGVAQQQVVAPAIPPPLPSAAATSANCDICEFSFRNESLRDMHFRLVHQNMPMQAVGTGGSSQSSVNMSPSNQSSSCNEPFKCHLCAKTFKSKGSLRVHLKVAHLMGLPYTDAKLNICERLRHKGETNIPTETITTNAASTAYALGSLHLTQTQHTQSLTANTSVVKLTNNGELLQPRDVASMGPNVVLVFNRANMTTEPAQHPPPQQQQQQKSAYDNFDYEHLNKALSPDNPKVWECDICAKSFTTKYFLKKHKRLHTGEMPYTCEICARTFTFQQSYHKHLLYHSEVKPHVCATCGRAFKELSTLHNHERIHSGEKPFKCEVCGKSFRQRVSFLVHTRIHTGVMPYKCEVCQKSFRYKVSQRTHKCLSNGSNASCNDTGNVEEATQSVTGATSADNEHLSEHFIKAFLERATANAQDAAQNSPASAEIASINDDAQLVQTIDDIVAATCQKMGMAPVTTTTPNSTMDRLNTPVHAAYTTHSTDLLGLQISEGSNSPSQQLQKMRLYSPELINDVVDNNFENFLLNNVSGSGSLL